jgi:hypothetical protein
MASKRQIRVFTQDFLAVIRAYGATAVDDSRGYTWRLETPLGSLLFLPDTTNIGICSCFEDAPRAARKLSQQMKRHSGEWNWRPYSFDTPATLLSRVQFAIQDVMALTTEAVACPA